MGRREEQADGKGSAVCVAREQLHGLLAGGVDRESNIISVLVEAMVRLMVQQFIEGEQGDFWVVAAAMNVALRVRSVPAT